MSTDEIFKAEYMLDEWWSNGGRKYNCCIISYKRI